MSTSHHWPCWICGLLATLWWVPLAAAQTYLPPAEASPGFTPGFEQPVSPFVTPPVQTGNRYGWQDPATGQWFAAPPAVPNNGAVLSSPAAILSPMATLPGEAAVPAFPPQMSALPAYQPGDGVPAGPNFPGVSAPGEAPANVMPDEELPLPDTVAEPVTAAPAPGGPEEKIISETIIVPPEEVIEQESWCEHMRRQPWFQFWSPKRFEVGGNMVHGTKDSWSFLTKTEWVQESARIKHRTEASGRYTEVNNVRSANEWIVTSTTDWKFEESPWLMFNKSSAEYDEIEKLTLRANTAFGLGYRWWEVSERRFLTTRTGPSVTYEDYFSPNESHWRPEIFFEIEAKHDIGRFLIEHRTTVYPSLDDNGSVRLKNDTGLLMPLDAKKMWNGKLGLVHNYNGNPNTNVQQNDYVFSFNLVYTR